MNTASPPPDPSRESEDLACSLAAAVLGSLIGEEAPSADDLRPAFRAGVREGTLGDPWVPWASEVVGGHGLTHVDVAMVLALHVARRVALLVSECGVEVGDLSGSAEWEDFCDEVVEAHCPRPDLACSILRATLALTVNEPGQGAAS